MAGGLLVLLVLGLALATHSSDYYTKVYDKIDRALYLYPNRGESEAVLGVCERGEACGAVYKRFWLPSVVVRACRCGQGPPCSIHHTPLPDPASANIDNRSQLKMCAEDSEVEECADGEGVRVEEVRSPEGGLRARRVWVQCRCDLGHWQLTRHTFQPAQDNTTALLYTYTYHCSKMGRCKKGDLCGHIRTDTYSTFPVCSCPRGHLCLNKDRTPKNVTELLYEGPAYRAYCLPVDN